MMDDKSGESMDGAGWRERSTCSLTRCVDVSSLRDSKYLLCGRGILLQTGWCGLSVIVLVVTSANRAGFGGGGQTGQLPRGHHN